jgi:hypothetical protein
MVLHSEQIDHEGHLIVFWCHFIQFSSEVDIQISHIYTYNNDIRHKIFKLTTVFSTLEHCVSLTATREPWEFYKWIFIDFRFLS